MTMFKKILVSDDLDSINRGVLSVTESLGIAQVVSVYYCDDALLRLKKAERDGFPFEVLVTDLSYKSDHRSQEISSGASLLRAVRAQFPKLKTIVYSIEDRPAKVRHFLQEALVDAFVCKGRKGLSHLKEALEQVAQGNLYLSPQVASATASPSLDEVLDTDVLILTFLAEGLAQHEISERMQAASIKPNSLSYVEKRLNTLKIIFKANNSTHLVARTKDLGII